VIGPAGSPADDADGEPAQTSSLPRNIEPTRSALSRLRAVRSRPYTIVWWAMRDA